MNATVADESIETMSELRLLFPDWRIGQLVANLVTAAGRTDEGALWEVEDEELFQAARRLIGRNRRRRTVVAESGAGSDRGGSKRLRNSSWSESA